MTDEWGAGSLRDGSILVVDDSAVVRAVVGGTLRHVGYTVVEAASGTEAIGLVGRHEFDVVVTDLQMPELDGFEVLEAVQRRSLHTEVIILTGTQVKDVSVRLRALRLGAHDLLLKPPRRSRDIVAAVDRALDKKRLKQANLRLLRDLEGLSRTDPLTGVWNRRTFEETMQRELLHARRHGLALGLVLLDVDDFERLNATYGRGFGDDLLKWFGVQVDDTLREGDTLHRFVGQEFAVVLPHTDAQDAFQMARRVVERLRTSSFQEGLTVTASAGVASGRGEHLQDMDLEAAADAALSRAKRLGGNRAVAAETTTAVESRTVAH
jgi:diguanylate cyclase (GGDEF)-like protein